MNKAYLDKSDDETHQDFVNRYKDKYFKATGKKLTVSKLSFHFNHHFNAKGAAVQKYNQLVERQEQEKKFVEHEEIENLPAPIAANLQRLHVLLEDKYLNDITLLNFSIREQLDHL